MPPRRSAASSQTKAQIEAFMKQTRGHNLNVVSVTQAGRDDLNRPIYMIRYYLDSPYGNALQRPAVHTQTLTWSGGALRAPALQGSGIPGGASNDPRNPSGITPVRVSRPGEGAMERQRQGMDELQRAKDKWLAQVAGLNNLEDSERSELISMIKNFQGSPLSLSNMVEQHLATRKVAVDEEGPFNPLDYLDFGGGGGGFSGPVYRAPDRRVVEDFVKGTMVSLLGTVQDGLVDSAVNLYMTDHRRDFDSPNAEIDPAQSVLEFMRGTEDYQELHALRPESEDERQWVGQRRQAAAQGGLQIDRQEDFARVQAAVGGDIADVREAGAVKQTAESGTTRGTILEQKVKRAATTLFEGIR